MTKRVKGGKVNGYCDRCGAWIYDDVPVPSTIAFFGAPVPEFRRTNAIPNEHLNPRPSLGTKAGDYCSECVAVLKGGAKI